MGMTVRILVAYRLLSRWFTDRMKAPTHPILLIWPKLATASAFALAFAVTYASAATYAASALDFRALFVHVAVGAVCFLAVLAVLWLQERETVSQLRQLAKPEHNKSD